jgi:hypothetical protein
MLLTLKRIAITAALFSMAQSLPAQSVTLAGRRVQFHGFFSQGFFYSAQNNYLTMKTSAGSFSFTDGGLNVSTNISEKFRVGAQAYIYNAGKLGNGHVQLDWALADYKFKDWFGIRAGQVKTVLGLYNDSQDLEFLHTWALLPQAVYPIDLRGDTIAHIGADAYGAVSLKKAGGLTYTVYGGRMPRDLRGGYVYGLTRSTRHIDSYGGTLVGADLRWNTPLKGLLAGASFIRQDVHTDGLTTSNDTPYTVVTRKNHTPAYYFQYSLGNLRIDGEYRRNLKGTTTGSTSTRTGSFRLSLDDTDSRLEYVSAAYRISKWLEVGTYHSRFYSDWGRIHGLPNNHIFDQAITARLDFKKYWDLKIEGHFMDGYASSTSDRGFYSSDNPAGKQPSTNMLVIRMGFHL